MFTLASIGESFQTLAFYIQYPFVRYALIAGVLIALCSSLLGVTLVLKRYSLIGDGLSHVAFLIMAIASVLKLSQEMVIVLPGTILAAILLLKKSTRSKISSDASLAMMSVASLAFGYLTINLFSTSANISADVCSTLFGSTSILTLSQTDVIICAALAVIVVVCFILFYNRLFAVTFDENFAKATGNNTGAYDFVIATFIAVIIVLAMNLVGSLLISALVIFPAASAMMIFSSFKSVTICSSVLSVVCALIGIVVSILMGTPVGSTIVAVDAIALTICYLIHKIRR